MKTKSHKKLLIFIVLIYILSYLLFTFKGSYELTNHGGMDWRNEWHPTVLTKTYTVFSGRTKSAITFVGVFYCPCIFIDRMFWHKTEELELLFLQDYK